MADAQLKQAVETISQSAQWKVVEKELMERRRIATERVVYSPNPEVMAEQAAMVRGYDTVLRLMGVGSSREGKG